MAAKQRRKIDIKKITRATTLGVFLVSLAGLLLTGWFIVNIQNDIATSQDGQDATNLDIVGINAQLLAKITAAAEKKISAEQALADDLPNPFRKEVPPPPPPAPPPAPTPETPPAQ